MKPARPKRCAYCGATGKLTRDHVPPKNLFPAPRPVDLITVPCCAECNSSFSEDDEHFRTMVACAEQPSSHPQAQRLWGTKIYRQLRGAGRPVIEELIRQSFGVPVGVTESHLREAALRVARVLIRIVKALHYEQTCSVFPNGWEVRVNLEPDFACCGGLAGASSVFRSAPAHEERSIGEGVFRYHVTGWPGRTAGNVWLLSFFECLPFLCTSGPPDE